MNKMFFILKWLWLIAAIGSFVAGLLRLRNHGFGDSALYFSIALIGAVMFMVNHKRIKNEKKNG